MLRTMMVIGGAAVAAMGLSVAALAQDSARSEPPAPMDQVSADRIERGAVAWAETCGRCHNMRSPSELPPELWNVSVTHMRVRANIPGDVAEDIKAFLMMSSESLDDGAAAAPSRED